VIDPCKYLGKDESCTLEPTLVCNAWLDWDHENVNRDISDFLSFCKDPDVKAEGYQWPCT